MVRRWCVEYPRALLKAKPGQPTEYRRCPAAFAGSLEVLVVAFSGDDGQPINNEFTHTEPQPKYRGKLGRE